jgi:predicted nucleotidyltransferase
MIVPIMVHMAQKWNNIEFEIVLLLIRERNHVRSIANILGEANSSISRKLNKLAAENIIDYRSEGKNKVFFVKNNIQAKNYVFSAEKYKFGKLIREYPKLGIIIDGILKKCNERLIILFGSYANFTAGKSSDIDIFVETDSRKVKEDIEKMNSRINVKTGPLDKDSLLVKEIIKNHVILRGEDDFYEKIKFFD